MQRNGKNQIFVTLWSGLAKVPHSVRVAMSLVRAPELSFYSQYKFNASPIDVIRNGEREETRPKAIRYFKDE